MPLRFNIEPGKLTALVVDNEPRIRAYMEQVIVGEGWQCVSVDSGDWAVEEVRRTHFDAIFMDLVMPGMNGAEALLEIRAADPTTKVVIVTGYPDSALMLDARRFDPDGLLVKPFLPADIQRFLKQFSGGDARGDEALAEDH